MTSTLSPHCQLLPPPFPLPSAPSEGFPVSICSAVQPEAALVCEHALRTWAVAEGSRPQSAGGHGRAAGGQTPSETASGALEGGGGQCSDHCLDLMTAPGLGFLLPQVRSPWSPSCPQVLCGICSLWHLLHFSSMGSTTNSAKAVCSECPAFLFPPASLTPNHLLSLSARGPSKGLLAPLSIGKKEHLLGIVAVCI